MLTGKGIFYFPNGAKENRTRIIKEKEGHWERGQTSVFNQFNTQDENYISPIPQTQSSLSIPTTIYKAISLSTPVTFYTPSSSTNFTSPNIYSTSEFAYSNNLPSIETYSTPKDNKIFYMTDSQFTKEGNTNYSYSQNSI